MTLQEINPINLTTKSIDALDDLTGSIDITRLNRNLRNLLLQHLSTTADESDSDFVEDVQYFFRFLDVLEDEKRVVE